MTEIFFYSQVLILIVAFLKGSSVESVDAPLHYLKKVMYYDFTAYNCCN